MPSKITIDGVTFTGNNIQIRGNGQVYVDGVLQQGTLNGVVEVRVVEGILGSLRSDAAVTCGEVRGDVTAGTEVNVSGGVFGNIQAGMDVRCRDVTGNVSAGMDVECGNVGGDATAGMGVRRR